jgi:hypothetical protein
MILHVLIAMIAGWMQRHQQQVIAYLMEENRVLTAQLGGRRLHLTDTERRRLAALAHPLGRQRLKEITTLVTPETLMRWYHRLIAQKFDGSRHRKRVGRPRVAEEIEQLVIRMAEENTTWGYRRIQGALANLGHPIDAITVRNVLRRHHMDPAPKRRQAGMRWSQFLKMHWEVLAATDFFTVEVTTWHGLVTYYVLVVMELATRCVCVAGITPHIPPPPLCSNALGSSRIPLTGSSWANGTCSMIGTPNLPKRLMPYSRTVAWSRSSYRHGVPISMLTVNDSCARSRMRPWRRWPYWGSAPCTM